MRLDHYRQAWDQKPALRAVYDDLYSKMLYYGSSGRSLEVGAGIGNLNILDQDLIRIDIQPSQAVDVAADAHFLPFKDESFANIYLVDVLHHLECPLKFLSEAQRVLTQGGRLIMVEPGITPISYLLYRVGHEEPVDMSWRPDPTCWPTIGRDPYESNQAIPSLLFHRFKESLIRYGITLKLIHKRRLSIVAYPLSGGFKPWSLLPKFLVAPILSLEKVLLPFLGWLIAFRIIIVLEK